MNDREILLAKLKTRYENWKKVFHEIALCGFDEDLTAMRNIGLAIKRRINELEAL